MPRWYPLAGAGLVSGVVLGIIRLLHQLPATILAVTPALLNNAISLPGRQLRIIDESIAV